MHMFWVRYSFYSISQTCSQPWRPPHGIHSFLPECFLFSSVIWGWHQKSFTVRLSLSLPAVLLLRKKSEGRALEHRGRLGHRILLFLSISENGFLKWSNFPSCIALIFLCFHTFIGEKKRQNSLQRGNLLMILSSPWELLIQTFSVFRSEPGRFLAFLLSVTP